MVAGLIIKLAFYLVLYFFRRITNTPVVVFCHFVRAHIHSYRPCPPQAIPRGIDTGIFEFFRLYTVRVPFAGVDAKPSDVDGLPYSTLLYGNGPGYSAEHRPVPMANATEAETHNRLHGAAVPRQWATHGGEDVPVYAAGPPGITQALFSGTVDQSYVPHAIAYIACLAEHADRCRREDVGGASNRTGSGAASLYAGRAKSQVSRNKYLKKFF